MVNKRSKAWVGMGVGMSIGAEAHGEFQCQCWLMDMSADGGKQHPGRAVSAGQLASGAHCALQWLLC